MATAIPIQNIYYLLSYAWNRLEESKTIDVSGIDSTELVDLFASILLSGVNHLIRKGLEQNYEAAESELAAVKGKVITATSARRLLLYHGKAYCQYDEFSANTLPNRIIKSTLKRLNRTENLNYILKERISETIRALHDISDINLTRQIFRTIQLHSNSRYYRFLINVCQLILDNLLVDESTGSYRFRDFIRDERRMAKVFESFIFNFIKYERPNLTVSRERIKWDAIAEKESDLSYLPQMETDISVRSQNRTLIIDAKYYSDTFTLFYNSESIHSSNLYQIFSYLKNLEKRKGPDSQAAGLLIYPLTNRSINLKYSIQGHKVSIRTIDLSKSWKIVHEELSELIDQEIE